jgi:glc operon protein GlcG
MPVLGCVCAAAWCGPASGQAVLEQPSITLNAAVKMVNACESLAKSKGWKVAIWVVDDNGLPVHIKRMEGASAQSIQTAEMKAKTSKSWQSVSDPSDAKSPLGKIVKEPPGQIESVLLGSLPAGGGAPVLVDGKLVGAIGVSGAGSAADGQCAQAAVNAVLKQ